MAAAPAAIASPASTSGRVINHCASVRLARRAAGTRARFGTVNQLQLARCLLHHHGQPAQQGRRQLGQPCRAQGSNGPPQQPPGENPPSKGKGLFGLRKLKLPSLRDANGQLISPGQERQAASSSSGGPGNGPSMPAGSSAAGSPAAAGAPSASSAAAPATSAAAAAGGANGYANGAAGRGATTGGNGNGNRAANGAVYPSPWQRRGNGANGNGRNGNGGGYRAAMDGGVASAWEQWEEDWDPVEGLPEEEVERLRDEAEEARERAR